MDSLKLFLSSAIIFTVPVFADIIPYTGVNGQQQYAITQSGSYQITAYGAGGGGATDGNSSLGGTGAIISGDFALLAGQTLDIFIGQQGATAFFAGGGGTWVALDASGSAGTLWLVAGGGGGANEGNTGLNAVDAVLNGGAGGASLQFGGGGGGSYLSRFQLRRSLRVRR